MMGALMRGVLVERARKEPAPDEAEPPAPVPVPGRRTRCAAIDWEELEVGPVQRREAGGDAPERDVVRVAAARGVATAGAALPYASTLQRLFGRHDVSAIQAHLGDDATAAAHAMGARGFATGHHVVFDGAPDLFTAAHEAAHVVQQRAGVHLAEGVGAVGDAYEQHANEVAEHVVRGESVEAVLDRFAPGAVAAAPAPAPGPVQQMKRVRPESEDQRITRLVRETFPQRDRAVVTALVQHARGLDDDTIRGTYPGVNAFLARATAAEAAALVLHAKIASWAEAALLIGNVKLTGGTQLVAAINHAKIASGAQLRSLVESLKVVSGAELTALLADAKVVSGAELATLLGAAKIDTAANLAALLGEAICPNTTALVAFFADAHVPSLAEVRREITSGAVARWDDWAARRNVTDVAAGAAANLAGLRGKSIAELFRYAQANAAWHAGIASSGERDQARALLDLVRNFDGVLEGCGAFNAGALHDAIVADGGYAGQAGNRIRAYARAVDGTDTCPANPVGAIDLALQLGRDVLLLEAALDRRLVHRLFTAATLADLRTRGYLADFLQYVATCHPTLSAREGHDIASYIRLRRVVDPVTFHAALGAWVVNLHRFERAALLALSTAVADRTKAKPVTVLIHSPLDADGAFHHDANLTAVITRAGHLTLMIEGKGTLGAVSGVLDTITATYCPGAKIANVMLVGHGEPTAINITGTVAADGRETDTGVSIEGGSGRDFLRDLIDRMVDSGASHLVLDACHTNATEVEATAGLGGRWRDDAAEIRRYMARHPSLAAFARDYVHGRQRLTVDGANGATRDGVSFLHGGALTLRSADDPAIAGTKLEYVEQGEDPKGVMRAVLEEWARTDGGGAVKRAVQARAQGASADFKEQVIRTLFAIIAATYWERAADIARMVDVAGAVKKLRYDEDCTMTKLAQAGLNGGELAALDRDLRGTTKWGQVPFLSIVFDQALGRAAQVVTKLGTLATPIRELVRADRVYVAAGFDFAGRLSLASVATASAGQVVLAIIGFKQHGNPAARAFLDAYLRQMPAPVLPGALGVTTASLQRDLGPQGPGMKDANLSTDGVTHTLHVKPLTRRGRANADTAAHVAPDVAAASLAVANTTALAVIGSLPGWYAVEAGQTTRFVPSSAVVLV